MNYFLFISPLTVLALAACVPLSQPQQSPTQLPVAMQQAAPKGRVIAVTAELWKFTPNVIQVKKGEVATVQVTGISGTHSFAVPDLGINQTVFMGKTVNILLPTDRAGTFDFVCSIQCGPGHPDMKGQIVITE